MSSYDHDYEGYGFRPTHGTTRVSIGGRSHGSFRPRPRPALRPQRPPIFAEQSYAPVSYEEPEPSLDTEAIADAVADELTSFGAMGMPERPWAPPVTQPPPAVPSRERLECLRRIAALEFQENKLSSDARFMPPGPQRTAVLQRLSRVRGYLQALRQYEQRLQHQDWRFHGMDQDVYAPIFDNLDRVEQDLEQVELALGEDQYGVDRWVYDPRFPTHPVPDDGPPMSTVTVKSPSFGDAFSTGAGVALGAFVVLAIFSRLK